MTKRPRWTLISLFDDIIYLHVHIVFKAFHNISLNFLTVNYFRNLFISPEQNHENTKHDKSQNSQQNQFQIAQTTQNFHHGRFFLTTLDFLCLPNDDHASTEDVEYFFVFAVSLLPLNEDCAWREPFKIIIRKLMRNQRARHNEKY